MRAGWPGWVLGAVGAEALLALTLCSAQPSSPQVAHSGGSCAPLPAEAWCSSFGLNGQQVFGYDGVDLLERDKAIKHLLLANDQASVAFTTLECLDTFKVNVCMSLFPLCDTETGLPRKLCKATCDTTHDLCAGLIELAAAAGLGNHIFGCEDTIGDPANADSNLYSDFLEEWRGDQAYEEGEYQSSVLGQEDVTLQCAAPVEVSGYCPAQAGCGAPLVSMRYPLAVDRGIGLLDPAVPEDAEYCSNSSLALDCTRCLDICELPCPTPLMYSDAQLTWQWVLQWVPGVLGLPLNVVVVLGENARLFRRRASHARRNINDCLVLLLGIFSIVIALIDSIPSLVLRSDMRCAGHPTFSGFANVDGSKFCRFGLVRVHILQAQTFALMCLLLHTRAKLLASMSMTRFQPFRHAQKRTFLLVFVVPAVLAVFSYALEADQLFESSSAYRVANGGPFIARYMHVPNSIRYAFTCGPKFSNVAEELFVVQLPLLLGGVLACGISMSILRKIGVVQRIEATAERAASLRNDANMPKRRGRGSPGRGSPLLVALARAVTKLAFLNVLLTCFNLVATLTFLPTAQDFGFNSWIWESCTQTQGSLLDKETLVSNVRNLSLGSDWTPEVSEAICGKPGDGAPPIAGLYVMALAGSVAALGTGVIFYKSSLRSFNLYRNLRSSHVTPNTANSAHSTVNTLLK